MYIAACKTFHLQSFHQTKLDKPFVFVIYCFITNCAEIQWFKTIINTYYLMLFLQVRNQGQAQLDGFVSRSLICHLGLQSSEGSNGAGDPLLRYLTHMPAGWQWLWVRRLRFSPLIWSLHGLLKYLHSMVINFLLEREQSESFNVSYDLASEVTCCHFSNILFVTQVSPIPYGR